MKAQLLITIAYNLILFTDGGRNSIGGISKWVLDMERRLERFQRTAIENFKNIDDPANYTKDTPREYDLRLPYFFFDVPKEMKIQTKRKPTIWDNAFAAVNAFLSGRNGEDEYLLKITRQYGKMQDAIPTSVPFPCDLKNGRSPVRPTSVHKLRPGDIDIVLNMGDSIAAGNMLAGVYVLQAGTQNRGLSAFGGGQGTWREFLTLPNILKLFNPNLYGYATGDNFAYEISARASKNKAYSLGEAAAFTDDLPNMFKEAVAKMRRDPKVDFERDWKMYTIFLGGMDSCHDLCYWKRPQEAVNHVKYTLDRAMTYLMKNSPRTIVNYVLPLDTHNYKNMVGLSTFCAKTRTSLCDCSQAMTFKNVSDQMARLIQRFTEVEKTVLEDPKYQTKEDFAIVVQPIIQNLTIPIINTSKGLSTDFRLLGPDCFHVSQRGHAHVAKELWNSLMSPPGEKAFKFTEELLSDIVCPTAKRPYISTLLNSPKY